MLFIALITALAAWPVFSGATLWTGSLLLACWLFFVCYVPTVALVCKRDDNKILSSSEGVMLLALGVAIQGALAKIAHAIGLPVPWLCGAEVLLSLWLLYRRPHNFRVANPQGTHAFKALATFLFVFTTLLQIVAALKLGKGRFPEMLWDYNDTPYFLGRIFSVIQSAGANAPDLGFSGTFLGGHLGSEASAASIVEFTGLPPHAALLGVIIPLWLCGTCAAIILLLRCILGEKNSLTMALALLGIPLVAPAKLYSVISAHNWQTALYEIKRSLLLTAPTLRTQTTDASGVFLILCGVIGLAALWRKHTHVERLSAKMLAVIAAPLLLAFKGPFFVFYGGGFALLALWRALRSRQYMMLWLGCLGLALALVTRTVFPYEEGPTHLVWAWFANTEFLWKFGFTSASAWWNTLLLPVWFIACALPCVIAMLLVFMQQRRSLDWEWLAFMIVPIFAVCFLALISQGNDPSRNIRQILLPVRYLWVVIAACYVGKHWDRIPLTAQACVMFIVILGYAPLGVGFVHNMKAIVDLGQEHTEHLRLVRDAMMSIPRSSDILVAVSKPTSPLGPHAQNTLYPAFDGHQMYATTLDFYGRDSRRIEQELLARLQWDDELNEMVRHRKWTHIVFDKTLQVPANMPFVTLHENARYLVVSTNID